MSTITLTVRHAQGTAQGKTVQVNKTFSVGIEDRLLQALVDRNSHHGLRRGALNRIGHELARELWAQLAGPDDEASPTPKVVSAPAAVEDNPTAVHFGTPRARQGKPGEKLV